MSRVTPEVLALMQILPPVFTRGDVQKLLGWELRPTQYLLSEMVSTNKLFRSHKFNNPRLKYSFFKLNLQNQELMAKMPFKIPNDPFATIFKPLEKSNG